jgi:hypothetical protein
MIGQENQSPEQQKLDVDESAERKEKGDGSFHQLDVLSTSH